MTGSCAVRQQFFCPHLSSLSFLFSSHVRLFFCAADCSQMPVQARVHRPGAIASLAAACCRPRVVAWIPGKRRGIGDAPADFTVPNDLVCVRYRFAPFSGWIRGHLRSLSAQDRRQLARWERRSKTPSFSLSRLCHGGCRGKHMVDTESHPADETGAPEHRGHGRRRLPRANRHLRYCGPGNH